MATPLSALSTINTSNAVSLLVSTGGRTSAATSILEPSATTFLSDIASDLLLQQATDPSLDIETALSRSLLNPAVAGSGQQLYTSSGALAQLSAAATLSRLQAAQSPQSNAAGNDNVVPAAAATVQGSSASQALTDLIASLRSTTGTSGNLVTQVTALADQGVNLPAQALAGVVANSAGANPGALALATQNPQNLIEQLSAASLLNARSAATIQPEVVAAATQDLSDEVLSGTSTGAQTLLTNVVTPATDDEGVSTVLTANTATVTTTGNAELLAATTTAAVPNEEANPLDQLTPAQAQATGQTTAPTTTAPDTTAAAQDLAFFTSDDQVPFGFDAYQQAALASGVTAFGKELNSFVPASDEAITAAAVAGVTAITPVMPIAAYDAETAEA